MIGWCGLHRECREILVNNLNCILVNSGRGPLSFPRNNNNQITRNNQKEVCAIFPYSCRKSILGYPYRFALNHTTTTTTAIKISVSVAGVLYIDVEGKRCLFFFLDSPFFIESLLFHHHSLLCYFPAGPFVYSVEKPEKSSK